MKDLLEFIVTGIVDKPKEVKIEESIQENETALNLSVDASDMGKVIGKNGQIIRALRTILQTCAFKQGKRSQLILKEDQV